MACVPYQSMMSIVFSPEGRHIASASSDGAVRLWNANVTENSDPLKSLDNEVKAKNISLSGNGKRVVVLTEDDKFILRNALNGNQICVFNAPRNILCITLDYSGSQAIFRIAEGTALLRPTENSLELGKYWEQFKLRYISFCPDGTRVASTELDGFIRILDSKEERIVGYLEIESYRLSKCPTTVSREHSCTFRQRLHACACCLSSDPLGKRAITFCWVKLNPASVKLYSAMGLGDIVCTSRMGKTVAVIRHSSI